MLHRNLRGQSELHSPTSELIENNSGSTIPFLVATKFNGIGSLYPQIVIANGVTDVIRGITQSDIDSGTAGYITSLGFMNGINTSAWLVGTTLYASSAGVIGTTPSGLPLASVLSRDATNGIIYVNSLGITKADLDALEFPDALSLELAWTTLYPNFYTELTYDINGRVTQSNVWDSVAKVVHVFNKTFTYTGALVTKVVVTRVYDGQTLEKDIVYDMSGKVLNITRIYTP
jgi:hypothetical protein